MKISNPRGLNNSPLITLDMLKKQLDMLQSTFEKLLTGDNPSAVLSNNGYVPLNDQNKIDTKYYDCIQINTYDFSTSSMIASPGYYDDLLQISYITLEKEIPGFVLQIENAADNKTITTECEYTANGTTKNDKNIMPDKLKRFRKILLYGFICVDYNIERNNNGKF